jgi:primosomal protein N'
VPAYIEIVERVPADQLEQFEDAGYLVPNEVRIEGIPLAVPYGEGIEVHGIVIPTDKAPSDGNAIAKVTLTLFARVIHMGHEAQQPGDSDA